MGGEIDIVGHLHNDNVSVVFATLNEVLFIAHLGHPLDDQELDPSLFSRGVVGGGLDAEVVAGIIPLPSQGWMGLPGLEVSREGDRLPLDLRFVDLLQAEPLNQLVFSLEDWRHEISVKVKVRLHSSGVVQFSTRVINNYFEPVSINSVHTCLPISGHANEILTLGGRHAMEAVQQRSVWGRTKQILENRSGRTSHEQLGVVFAGTPGFTEQTGDVWGVHVAWSGNFRIMCDGVSETLKTIHAGELLHPDEIVLDNWEEYEAPDVVVSYSSKGLAKASQQFHHYLRSFRASSPKPVVLNTWEAVYFNHDLDTLKNLATVAARVGIERFVLDDGWFHARRNDTAGLGDWWVDESVWPQGLEPLISHVTALGMDFGLWFEPEMVNPNSNLYRSHPEWVLDGSLDNPLLGRHQLVLDMAQEDLREYLFEKIDLMLRTYDIAYVKWDHNRPLVAGATHHQTRGFYELLSSLKFAHPSVQFESCASGGGRIDMGVAKWAERFWASDSIDALDRLEIQKGLTTFIPPEMLGSHIGSPTCHTTGRKHSLSFRAATALFGWLGVEWNLLNLTEREEQQLTSVIEFYKQRRSLIHGGNFIRVDHADSTIDVRGVMSQKQDEGIFSVSRLRSGPSNYSAPLRLPVNTSHSYTVSLVHLGSPRWALHRELPEWVNQKEITVSGAVLANVGLPMPALLPESSFILEVGPVTPT